MTACRDLGFIPRLGRSPGEGKRLPTPVFWPGEFHGHMYSPWGHKELNTTEQTALSCSYNLDCFSVFWGEGDHQSFDY